MSEYWSQWDRSEICEMHGMYEDLDDDDLGVYALQREEIDEE